ncbi:hypothetical protein CASFOL_036924 [Castilleja foliolosa]|uniref:RING-type domain-containing protein n=1 Tax=Castilleja foliolosa TaxID=1961234 RepID=A0ABD3BQ72_9LAMI
MDPNLGYGYEYSYAINMDDNIIPACIEADILSSNDEALAVSNLRKVHVFVIQTKFKVIRKLDDDESDMYDCEMMETEDLRIKFLVSADRSDFRELFDQQFSLIHFRLSEYLMPDDQILALIRQVFDFTQEIVSVDPSVPIVPIVVDVDVCTLQLDGETIYDTFDRAVTPDCLTPLEPVEKENKLCRRRVWDFLLYDLPRVRVDKGSGLMEECPICMCGPSRGSLVSWLPCKHAFHSHCVTRWLIKRQSCPLCRHEIVLDKGG